MMRPILGLVLVLAILCPGCAGPDNSENRESIRELIDRLSAESPSVDCDGAPWQEQEPRFNLKGTLVRDNETGHYYRIEAVGKYLVNWSNVETYAEGNGIRVSFNSPATLQTSISVPSSQNDALNLFEAFGQEKIEACDTLNYCRESDLQSGIRIAIVSPMWDETWGTQKHSNVWSDLQIC